MTASLRRREERGTALVEFALIGLVFFSLIFALFDFSLYFNSREGIRHGVRQAGRVAIVNLLPPPSGSCTTNPSSISGTDRSLVCLVKADIGQRSSSTSVDVLFPDGAAKAGNHISICAIYPTSATTGLTSPFIPSRVTSEVTLRLEQPLSGVTVTGTQGVKEIATSGDWTFCE